VAAEVAHLPVVAPDADLGPEVWEDGALTVQGAVHWTGASRSELYRAMGAGEVAWTMKGRRRLIAKRSLVRWLAQVARGA